MRRWLLLLGILLLAIVGIMLAPGCGCAEGFDNNSTTGSLTYTLVDKGSKVIPDYKAVLFPGPQGQGGHFTLTSSQGKPEFSWNVVKSQTQGLPFTISGNSKCSSAKLIILKDQQARLEITDKSAARKQVDPSNFRRHHRAVENFNGDSQSKVECPEYPSQFVVGNSPEPPKPHKKPDITKHTMSCQIRPGELRHQLDQIKKGSCKNCVNDYKEARDNYEKDMLIPVVFKRDGEYFVYIYEDSPYHKEFGYYGKRSYGRNRRVALELFIENFPDVPVPEVLRYDGDRREAARNCPFILHDGNPCATRACRSVDWSEGDIYKHDLTDDCKWNIASYCTRNAGRDPACACWDTEGPYYNTKYCRKFRKKFETPHDYKCKIDLFEIEEHPDMKNYIQKDKIPCWNCDLDAPAKNLPLPRKWTSPTE